MDELFQDGCACLHIENKDNVSIGDVVFLFEECPHECQPIRHLVIDGKHLLVLPDCVGSLL